MLIGSLPGREGILLSESLGRFAQCLNHARMQELAGQAAKGHLRKAPAKGGLEHGISEKGVASPWSALEDSAQVLAQRVAPETRQPQSSTCRTAIELCGQRSVRGLGRHIHRDVPSASPGRWARPRQSAQAKA